MLLDDPETRLSRYLLKRTVEEAETYLYQRLETATLFYVCTRHCQAAFRKLVPREVARDQDRLLPSAGHPYSEGELTCLELISETLFPFAYEHLEMAAQDEGERLANIPLYSFGIEHLSSGFGEYNAGWTMLALLNRNITPSEATDLPARVLSTVVVALSKARWYSQESWSWDIFKATCAAAGSPLVALPIAIQMLDHDTGNLFLDPTDEMAVEDATWSLEDIELLTKEWKEAQDLHSQAERLTEWLAEDPARRFRKVIDVWNLATWNMLMG